MYLPVSYIHPLMTTLATAGLKYLNPLGVVSRHNSQPPDAIDTAQQRTNNCAAGRPRANTTL
ncbi:hypothetical protein CC85DRAFT_287699, partial [Cutaneotrichosporon oleaginosum]